MGADNGRSTATRATQPEDTTPCESTSAASPAKAESTPDHPEHLTQLFPDGIYAVKNEEFLAQVAAIRAEMAPLGTFEKLLVDRAILSIWRLRKAAIAEAAGTFDEKLLRYEAHAERTLFKTLEKLERRAERRETKAAAVAPPLPMPTPVDPDDLGVLRPRLTLDANSETVDVKSVPSFSEEDPCRPVRWQARLAFDPDISLTSPVVRGTWVTASHVCSLVVDGWTWADLLRSHPELNEEDIRACLAYIIEEDHHNFPS